MRNGIKNVVASRKKEEKIEETPKKLSRIALSKSDAILWSFSFRFWSQIKDFGVDGDGISNQWMIGVIERFKELSEQSVDKVVFNTGRQASADRYHKINWGAKNIPIKKEDIQIPDEYKGEEYELYQFDVSKGTGRIIGFFDEKWIFNIVLFDPLHNMQPSNYTSYKIRKCFPLDSEVKQLQKVVEKCIAECETHDCKTASKLKEVSSGSKAHYENFEVLVLKISSEGLIEKFEDVVANKKLISKKSLAME